jgi:hypothetical protein
VGEGSVDELLPAVLARAAGSASELAGSPSPDAIRRRGEQRHRRRIAATVSASVAGVVLVASAAVAALGDSPRSGHPIAPPPPATETDRTPPAKAPG